MATPTADIGLIGLAVMGENLVLNMESHGYTVAVFNRTTAQGGRVHRGPRQGQEVRRLPLAEGSRRSDQEAAEGDDARQGRRGRGRGHRRGRPAPRKGRHPHRRRQHALPGHHPAHEGTGREGHSLHRHRRLRRRGRRAQGAEHHARRRPDRVAGGEADLPGHRREGEGTGRQGRAVLRLGRPRGRGPLRQDGPQRHRVRRHAAHLRVVPAA